MITSHRALALSLTIASITAIASILVIEGLVRAEKTAAPAAISVRYDDLDFNHVSDAQILLDRIEAASVKVCGGAPDFHDQRRALIFDQCRKSVVIQAVRRFDQPVLTAIADPQALSMRLAVQ